MHRIAGLVLDPNLDARRFGEVIENLRGLPLGKLGPWTSPAKRELIEEINTAIGREAFAEAQTDELVFQRGTNQ